MEHTKDYFIRLQRTLMELASHGNTTAAILGKEMEMPIGVGSLFEEMLHNHTVQNSIDQMAEIVDATRTLRIETRL